MRRFMFLIGGLLLAQTQVDYQTQLKNLPQPWKVEVFTCVGSGTNAQGQKWDCGGEAWFKITGSDGKVVEVVGIPPTPEIQSTFTTDPSKTPYWKKVY